MGTGLEQKIQKRAVNLRVDSKMLDEAKAANINLSLTLEQALATMLKAERETKWVTQNRAAMDAINERIAREGLWNDSLRPF